MKRYFVYIMSNKSRRLYTGITRVSWTFLTTFHSKNSVIPKRRVCARNRLRG